MIAAIFAVDTNGGLGYEGTLPWPKNSEDLKWFKTNTQGQIVVMGRRTWDDPMMPKPLPNRANIVISNRSLDDYPTVTVFSGDWLTSLKLLRNNVNNKDIFIIGGAGILQQCLPILDKIYLTKINTEYPSDVTIDVDSYLSGFECTHSNPTSTCTFTIYEKLSRSTTTYPG